MSVCKNDFAIRAFFSHPNQIYYLESSIMKLLLATAIASLGVVLSPVVFAQDTEPAAQMRQMQQAQQMQQPANPQHVGTQRADDSGYGMESSGTSNASVAQTSRHDALMSHERRNDLFAHH
ncbi:hypothetical protein M3I53_09545 [Paraburkholderia sp. CNPSo 3272]|uniref:hypothetical protein n=1 Tax=Paraburkholderia sp. CNPSo 3272 TaxID=2940931 RepID=UPI0020B73D69|nr:hypothetical protein [Paraburkholderia sp. CNPSo 3272]MCP3723376.1 hypothetical protein [Paraburkholderia sp. CNPSo 3272]